MLLEKAWAKLHGSYFAIARGLPGEALGDLTGAPVQFIPVDSPALFQRISEATCNDPQAKGKGWFVCGVIPLQDPTGQPMKYVQRAGLLPGHAYGVLDARVVDDDCLLKLRNPFGEAEFTGEWSDNSNRWNNVSEEKKKNLGYERAEYGAFWMGLADFKAYFAGVQMCKHIDGWKHTGTLLELSPLFSAAVRMQFSEASTLCVSIHQRGREDARSLWEEHALCGLRLMVVRGDDYAMAAYRPLTVQRDISTAFFCLPAGTHWAVVSHGGDKTLELGVSVYSEREAMVTAGGVKGSKLRETALARRAKKNSDGAEMSYLSTFPSTYGAERVSRLHHRERDIFVWHFMNKSKWLFLREHMRFELSNVRIAEVTGEEVWVKIAPGEEQTVVLEHMDGNKALHWSLECDSELESISLQTALKSALDWGRIVPAMRL